LKRRPSRRQIGLFGGGHVHPNLVLGGVEVQAKHAGVCLVDVLDETKREKGLIMHVVRVSCMLAVTTNVCASFQLPKLGSKLDVSHGTWKLS